MPYLGPGGAFVFSPGRGLSERLRGGRQALGTESPNIFKPRRGARILRANRRDREIRTPLPGLSYGDFGFPGLALRGRRPGLKTKAPPGQSQKRKVKNAKSNAKPKTQSPRRKAQDVKSKMRTSPPKKHFPRERLQKQETPLSDRQQVGGGFGPGRLGRWCRVGGGWRRFGCCGGGRSLRGGWCVGCRGRAFFLIWGQYTYFSIFQKMEARPPD